MNFSAISIRLQAKRYDFTRLFDAKHHVKRLILPWESYDSVKYIALNNNKNEIHHFFISIWYLREVLNLAL